MMPNEPDGKKEFVVELGIIALILIWWGLS